MSSALGSVFPPGIVILGGVPLKHPDFAASIVFIIAYALVVPLALWRIISPASRGSHLVRPSIFVIARLATFVVRAKQADGNYQTGLFITEQILLLCGYILLISTLLALVGYQAKKGWAPDGHGKKDRLLTLHRLGEIALIVAIALGITAGSQYGSLSAHPDQINKVRSCRDANGIISTVISATCVAAAIYVHLREQPAVPLSTTLYTVACGVLICIGAGYKLFLYYGSHPPSPFSTGGKAAFYLLSALPEFLVVFLYFSVNLEALFSIREGAQKDKDQKAMKKGKYVGAGYTPDGRPLDRPYGGRQSDSVMERGGESVPSYSMADIKS